MKQDGAMLPCSYGYSTTIRRAQGQTLDMGCLFFDHSYPADRGYGYVGASRFKCKEDLYIYGKLRRTDWLPTAIRESDVTHRSIESQSDGSDDERTDYESDEDMDGNPAYATDSEEDRDLSDLAIGPADTGEAPVPAALSLLLAL